MTKKKIAIVFCVFVSVLSFSQTIEIKGIVKDSLQNSLAYANVIAKPVDASKNLKFAITDEVGNYRIELIKNEVYTISVSYLGYKTANFKFTATTNVIKNFNLSEAPNQLKEVNIELPVTVKEDTIIYNTKKFVTGDERKLKNVLKKLPGVEVDKNGGVTVQGKKVTKMLVEGKKFFGGNTKLAVENIPADAVDKVQVIDNYSEVAFLKNLTDANEMAMNIQLKEDKKQFVFGDVEAGKGNQDFYKTSSNLFYYSPKTNVNFIGNLNNMGEKSFTYKDYFNFQGGVSAVLKGNSSIYNVSGSGFSQFLETQDLVSSQNRFGALNITKNTSKKLEVSGFAIFSHTNTNSFTQSYNQYAAFNEEKDNNSNVRNILGIAKLNIEYAPNTKEQWYFKTQLKRANNQNYNTILSTVNSVNATINTQKNATTTHLNQVVEWHKKLSNKHTFSFAADYTFDKNTPTTFWETNQPILQGLIPIVTANIYNIQQQKEVKTNSFNNLFKHYWVLNNNHHIYTTIGDNFLGEQFYTNDLQFLDNGSENNFSANNFGNDVTFNLNDLFLGVEFKYKTGIFTLKQGLFLHNYNWKVQQLNKFKNSKLVLLPSFLAKIEFTKSKYLRINYNLKTSFSDVSKLANRFYLQSYNSVFKGNENLENELYHSARIYFSRFSLYKGLRLFSGVSYAKKIKGVQNAVQFQSVNQYLSPVLITNPSENWNFNSDISKKIKQFKYHLSGNLSLATYLQNINNSLVTNKNKTWLYEASTKTLFDNFPTIELGFRQSFGNYTSSNITSKFVTTEPFLNIDYDFLKGFIFSMDYTNYKYVNKTYHQKNTYQIANAILSYKKEDSAWSFKIKAQNLFNVQFKQQNSFSSYIISDSKTYILPRIVLFSIGYNL
ncbi:MAG: carboxypeptidase-like regulatory domain-containing protein [Lutibacter sp.]|uniref:carboxypeptidase-like regulatory domain-containing protein n=1 Tax=Lutibacter sp. TaxID=1925666 RepID=UPI00299E6323|nr:carboxypeptidase-like regulatory domain-containing protein [Lutibacter sp.]MDX1830297.1 carboxypeptidase-like regulatory domain-containing protein [Lutibacter sp.]